MPLELLVDWFPTNDDTTFIVEASSPTTGAIAFGEGQDFRFIAFMTNGEGVPANLGPEYEQAWFPPIIGQYLWLKITQIQPNVAGGPTGLRGPPQLFRVRVLGP